MNRLIPFDIETKPDFTAVKELTNKFDRSKVAVGNRGEEKAEEKRDNDEAKYWGEAFNKAAFDPSTSTICAIGMALPDEDKVKILTGDEFTILTQFWTYFREFEADRWCFYTGNNGKGLFDFRHIYVRSLVHDVKMTHGIVNNQGFVKNNFIDLALIFLAGADYNSFCGLDRCLKILKLTGKVTRLGEILSKEDLNKNLGINGGNFHELQESNPEAAEIYLRNDIVMTLALAERLLA